MTDTNRVSWNSDLWVWEPIPEEMFGKATEFRGRVLTEDAPEDGDVYIWDATEQMWVLGHPTAVLHATTHELGGTDEVEHDNLSGAGTKTHAQLDSHVDSTLNPHSVTYTQADAEPSGAVATHASITESVHGFDASGNAPPQDHGNESHTSDFALGDDLDDHILDSTNPHSVTAAQSNAEPAGAVASHAGLTVNVHGVISGSVESTTGAASKVSAHADDTTGVHGVGASYVESTSGAQTKVNTHASTTSGIHGVGGYDVASVNDIANHSDDTTYVHGVGGYDVASVNDITTSLSSHASAVSTHGVQQATKSSDQGTSSTSFVNVTDLYFTMSAGKSYQVDVTIRYTTNTTTTGINLGVNGASGGDVVGSMETYVASSTIQSRTFSSYNETGLAFTDSLSGDNVAIMSFLITADLGGYCYIRFACEGQSQSVTVKAGSTLRAVELD